MFLGEGGKNEVRLGHGQEAKLCLKAFCGPFSPDSTGADSDTRLNDMVAGALRISARVDERHDARLLIIFHRHPGRPGEQAQ